MLHVVDPLTDTGGEEALGTPMALADQGLVFLHGDEEGGGRAKGKEMVDLRFK